MAAACTGTITGTYREEQADAGAANADANLGAIAKKKFDDDVVPMLEGFCAACHTAVGAVGFLAPDPEIYDSVVAWPGLIDIDTPANSRMVTKGSHDGPAWLPEQIETIRDWIDLEAAARGVETSEPPETAAFTPVVGINTVELDSIGLPGTTLTFRLEQLTVGMYLSEITVNAGSGGARLKHPLFVPWVDGLPLPDPVDRFAELDLTVEEAQTAMLGGGTLVLVGIPNDAQLSIHFEEVALADGTPGGLIGGCKDVVSFTANAQPRLSANCASCHDGSNSQATNATDMTRINDLSLEGQQAACGQILSRVNLMDPINSGIFIAPDPLSGAVHPFKFPSASAFDQFTNGLLVWIATE